METNRAKPTKVKNNNLYMSIQVFRDVKRSESLQESKVVIFIRFAETRAIYISWALYSIYVAIFSGW